VMCNYGQHYRDGTKVCDSCKVEHADYARRWRRDGPAPRNGLPELIVDYVATNEPVTIRELQTIVAYDKPSTNVESVRRVAYRLLDRGVLIRDGDKLMADADAIGYGKLDCRVCGRPYAYHPLGHCPTLDGEPVLIDPPDPRTIARRRAKA
jgi:hypothetical protein